MTTTLILIVLVSVCFQAASQILLKKAMVSIGPVPPLAADPLRFVMLFATNLWLWAGLISCVASLGVWLAVLARTPISVAYPMLSLGYVVAAIVGVTWFGEVVTLLRATAMALIMVGVFLIARSA